MVDVIVDGIVDAMVDAMVEELRQSMQWLGSKCATPFLNRSTAPRGQNNKVTSTASSSETKVTAFCGPMQEPLMVPQGARPKGVNYWQAQETKERESRRQTGFDGKHSRATDGRDGGRGDNDERPAGGEHWANEKEEVRARAT